MNPMTTTRATCPYCGRRVALTATGKLYKHTTGPLGVPCIRRSPN